MSTDKGASSGQRSTLDTKASGLLSRPPNRRVDRSIHEVPLFLCRAANKCRAGAVRDGRMRASGSVMIMLISN